MSVAKLFNVPPTKLHTGADIYIRGCSEFGYVFAYSEEEDMYLISAHDGKSKMWCHRDELVVL